MNRNAATAVWPAMLLSLCQTGCLNEPQVAAREHAHNEVEQASGVSTIPAPSLQELGRLSYHGIYDQPVTLSDGVYEGPPYVDGGAARPRLTLIESFYLVGDLGGQRAGGSERQDAAVLLAEQASGSGTRIYLAVAGRDAASVPVNLGTALLGDRVQVVSGRIRDLGMDLRLVRAGPGDAACCPGELVDTRWQLIDGALVQHRDAVAGRLSTAEWSGQSWRLAEFGKRQDIGDGQAVTLRLEGQRVSGNAGCNNYFGSIEDGVQPGEIRVGMLAGTRMACEPQIMDLESAYMQALQQSNRFRFLAGRLALSSVEADGTVTNLIFARAPD